MQGARFVSDNCSFFGNITNGQPLIEPSKCSISGNTSVNVEKPFLYVSEEDYYSFKTVVYVLVIPVLCCFGLLGNSLGFALLWKDARRQLLPLNMYLFALTLFDALYVFFGFIRSVFTVTGHFHTMTLKYFEENLKVKFLYIDVVLSYTSSVIILLLASERLVALVRPLTVKHFVLSKSPRPIIGACFATNAIVLLPYLFFFKVTPFTNYRNQTDYVFQYEENMAGFMEQYIVFQAAIHNFLPVFLLLIANVAIPVAYWRALKVNTRILQMSVPQENYQIKITSIVLVITVLFCLFSFPDLYVKVLVSVDQRYKTDGRFAFVVWAFLDISKIFMYLNASVDFLIYILASNHYRQSFYIIFCRRKTTSSGSIRGSSKEDSLDCAS